MECRHGESYEIGGVENPSGREKGNWNPRNKNGQKTASDKGSGRSSARPEFYNLSHPTVCLSCKASKGAGLPSAGGKSNEEHRFGFQPLQEYIGIATGPQIRRKKRCAAISGIPPFLGVWVLLSCFVEWQSNALCFAYLGFIPGTIREATAVGYFSSFVPVRATQGRLGILSKDGQPQQRFEKGEHWQLGRWSQHLLPCEGGVHVYNIYGYSSWLLRRTGIVYRSPQFGLQPWCSLSESVLGLPVGSRGGLFFAQRSQAAPAPVEKAMAAAKQHAMVAELKRQDSASGIAWMPGVSRLSRLMPRSGETVGIEIMRPKKSRLGSP
eukprot:219949-Amphidinium_carterae.4